MRFGVGHIRVASAPAGPSGVNVLRYQAGMLRNPLATYSALQQKYGDVVSMPLRRNHMFFLLNRPEYAEHVLVRHQDRYVKGFMYRPLKAFLGDGLLTAEGSVWQRHRGLAQPVFNQRHVQSFAPAIVDATLDRVAQWEHGTTIDIADEMRKLAIDVIGRVLFGVDLSRDAASIGRAEMRLQRSIAVHAAATLPMSLSPERLRAVAARILPGLNRAACTLESLTARIIDRRIGAPGHAPGDLLDLLLGRAQDDDALSRAEIEDEVKTLLIAGHETTTNALTWTLILLSQNPSACEQLLAEVDEVSGGRDPHVFEVDSLPWTQAVISEALRLYPPACYLTRDALQSDNISGIPISAGDTIGLSPYLLHRHPEFWPEPEKFDPQRFLTNRTATHPRSAYLPFGGGRRICLGASLAQLELTLVLAVLSRFVRVDLVPAAPVRARADVTLHPAGPVVATVISRLDASATAMARQM